MGDARYRVFYDALEAGTPKHETVRALADDELVSALAACSKRDDEVRANVLATELHNRLQVRLRAEGAQRETEERYRILVEESPYGLVLSTFEGTVLHVSPAAERLTGWSQADLMAAPPFSAVHEDDREKVIAARGLLVAGCLEATLTFRSSRRPDVQLLARIRPFDLGVGQTVGTVSVIREASETEHRVHPSS